MRRRVLDTDGGSLTGNHSASSLVTRPDTVYACSAHFAHAEQG